MITSPAFGPDPMSIQCPSCRQLVNTRIDFESSTKTHLMAALLCLLCWPCFCKLINFFLDSLNKFHNILLLLQGFHMPLTHARAQVSEIKFYNEFLIIFFYALKLDHYCPSCGAYLGRYYG